jgi:hypothetical protein
VGQAVSLLSSVLRELDLGDSSPQAVELGWAAGFTGDTAARIQAAIVGGRRLLPPQVLLVAIKEALRYCAAGPASDDFSGREVVLRAAWGIADEFMASQYFNVVAHPLPLMARTQAMWRNGWAPSVSARVQKRADGQPAELFLEATGCEMDAFLGAAVHLWVQAQLRGHLRFPPEFFRRTGIDSVAVDRFLEATSAPLADLQEYAAHMIQSSTRGISTSCVGTRSSGSTTAPCRSSDSGSCSNVPSGRCLSSMFGAT